MLVFYLIIGLIGSCYALDLNFNKIKFPELSRDEYTLLPNKMELDHYDSCYEKKELFCKIYMDLKPINRSNPSKVWKAIEVTANNPFYFNRAILYHAKCVKARDSEAAFSKIQSSYNKKFAKDAITVEIVDLACMKKQDPQPIKNTEDVLVILGFLGYFSLIVYATWRTSQIKKSQPKPLNKYVQVFALQEVFNSLRSTNKGEDYNNLKSMQGMRTLAMVVTVWFHSFAGNQAMFFKNQIYYEDFFKTTWGHLLVVLCSYVVQVYFLFSAWLVAVQVKNFYNKNGTITLKDIMLMAVNRYLRLIPPVIATIFLHRHNFPTSILPDTYRELVEDEAARCKKYAWMNFFFIQNIFSPKNMCSPGTWYIATDTQLYALSLIILFLKYRFNVKLRYTIGLILVYCSWVQADKFLFYGIEGLIRMRPAMFDPKKFLFTKQFIISYVHTYSNVQTYMVGLLFGVYYVDNKNRDIFNTWFKRTLCWLAFFILPGSVLLVARDSYSINVEAIWGLTSKAIFASGIGIGVLGMSSKRGGLIKRFFEWKPLVVLANFTYCTYMYHFLILFSLKFRRAELVEYDDVSVFRGYAFDVALSFFNGFLMYVLIEQPIGQLQQLVIPQLKKIPKKEA